MFLTNTLEPIEPQAQLLLPAVTAEVKAAQAVKDKAILVIVGNPPYSGHSKNNSPYVKATIDAYKLVNGKPLGEKNPKWLQDDYVKFIRFAQMKMDAVEEGVVGIITNHSWLDNPTFRGMRRSLMQTFDQIYVLDLHGNSKKKERAPDGSKDENVFDIEQGVAISLFVKKPGLTRGIWRGDLWGSRLMKYAVAAERTLASEINTKLTPTIPQYAFVVRDLNIVEFYEAGTSIPDIFDLGSVGLMTARDNLCIQFTDREAIRVVRDFASLETEEARRRYNLGDDVRDWRVEWAQNDIRESKVSDDRITSIMYRPFDIRWTYYTGHSRGFHCYPRSSVSEQMLNRQNIALLTARSNKSPEPNHFFVTEYLSEAKTGESTTQSYFFPLWRSESENFAPTFRSFLDARYDHHYTPEEILGYIYAVLHAPCYRSRYAEFLRIDFPRIPFAEAKQDFDGLSTLGSALVEVHLLRKRVARKLAVYHGRGDHLVEAVRYSLQEQAIWINKSRYFSPVPDDVWNFHIGGYQVLDKYLKSRKGRTLSLDEIEHVDAVAGVLAFMISQMAEIDTAYGAAFPAGKVN